MFTSKGKSKNYYMQYYDKLVACFHNKSNFMKWRSNFRNIFDKKTESYGVREFSQSYFLLGMCQGVILPLHA